MKVPKDFSLSVMDRAQQSAAPQQFKAVLPRNVKPAKRDPLAGAKRVLSGRGSGLGKL